LGDLASLEILELTGNRVVDLTPLERLTQIRKIKITSSDGSLKIPPSLQKVCDLVTYVESTQFSPLNLAVIKRRISHQAIDLGKKVLIIGSPDSGGGSVLFDKDSMSSVEVANDFQEADFSAIAISETEFFMVGGLLSSAGGVIGRIANINSGRPNLEKVKAFAEIPSLANSSLVRMNDGRILITGGDLVIRASGNQHSGTFAAIFDPRLRTVKVIPGLRTPRSDHRSIVLPSGEVMIIGGRGSNGYVWAPIRSIEIFSPQTNSFRFAKGMLREGRFGHELAMGPDGVIAVVGGTKGQNGAPELVKSIEWLDPKAERVVDSSDLGTARSLFRLVQVSADKAIAFGGIKEAKYSFMTFDTVGSDAFLNDAEVIDLYRRSTVTLSATMTVPRAQFTATLLGNSNVLIVGGSGDAATTSEVLVYHSLPLGR
jgi:hypothetical protein